MERGEGLVLCHGHNLEIQELEAKLRELEKKTLFKILTPREEYLLLAMVEKRLSRFPNILPASLVDFQEDRIP